jgi:DNA-binding transcriptional ArsR family regulator
MVSLFSGLITSKMRIRILMRLFLNPKRNAYLRELANEFDASPSHIKEELDQLKEANLLTSRKNGRQVLFSANQKHPVFNELHSMVKKALGMDQILESMIKRLGNLEMALLVDDYAEGKDSGIIDLVLIGNIDQNNLQDLTKKTERYINRKIRTLSLTADEYMQLAPNLDSRPNFLLWKQQI